MNRRSGSLISIFMTLLLLLIGSLLIYGNTFNREIGDMLAELLVMPVVGTTLGIILIFSVVMRWLGGVGTKKDDFINFHAEGGSVGISTKAICDFIERIGEEFSAIKSIDSRLSGSKDAVDIQLNVKVISGNKIPELSHVLQQRVRESVRESLGLDEIRNITIKVQEIVGEPPKSAAAPSPEA